MLSVFMLNVVMLECRDAYIAKAVSYACKKYIKPTKSHVLNFFLFPQNHIFQKSL
jgi:hypothetical protein